MATYSCIFTSNRGSPPCVVEKPWAVPLVTVNLSLGSAAGIQHDLGQLLNISEIDSLVFEKGITTTTIGCRDVRMIAQHHL